LDQVRVVLVDPSLPVPAYETTGAAAFDLYCRVTTRVPPRAVARIPANVIVEVPDGYVLVVALRSSTPLRKRLLSPHGVGIIDRDFCGAEDEIHVQVWNFGDSDVIVERGERIAQGLFVRSESLPRVAVERIERGSRGGFGSTGT
jgi:dUTP pyrophosphatase